MKRFINGVIILILAAAITAGGAYLFDMWHSSIEKEEAKPTEVTSDMTQRIYGLASGDDTEIAFGALDDAADAYAAKKVAASGGGKYTDSSGETHYVASSSGGGYSGGGYSGGGYSGGSSGGGGSSDDGPGYLVDVEVDDTPYNYCQDCGREYIGWGDCPYPDCPSHNLN